MVDLVPEDYGYLDSTHPNRWRMVAGGPGKYGLVIDHYSLPQGYDNREATLMLLIPSGYPGVGIDMFWFDPPLAKTDDPQPCGLSEDRHFARPWQRWSRHYRWRPGEHTVASHLEFVRNELCAEVR